MTQHTYSVTYTYSSHLALVLSYCGGMDRARRAVEALTSETEAEGGLLAACQRGLGHQLPLSSYLLKPVQVSCDWSPDLYTHF